MTKMEEQEDSINEDFMLPSEGKKEKKKKRKRELAVQEEIANQIDQIQDSLDSNKKKKKKDSDSDSAKKFSFKLSESKKANIENKSIKADESSKELPSLNKGKGPKMIVAEDNSNQNTDNKNPKKLSKKQKKLLRQNKNIEHETKGQIEALSYLRLWKSARNSWKFNSNRQSWLVRHALYEKRIKDSDFEILIDYFKEMKGNIREIAKANANKKLEESLLVAETAEKSTENANKAVSDPARIRARLILLVFNNEN